jgi:hypothetical protein
MASQEGRLSLWGGVLRKSMSDTYSDVKGANRTSVQWTYLRRRRGPFCRLQRGGLHLWHLILNELFSL